MAHLLARHYTHTTLGQHERLKLPQTWLVMPTPLNLINPCFTPLCGSPRTDKLRLRVEDGGEVTVYSRGVETRVPSLKVVAVKCSGDSCLGKEWAVLEALVPDGATLGRGRRLLYATKDGHSAHRWVAGELRGESEGVASFRCVVPTANGRQELVLPLRQVV